MRKLTKSDIARLKEISIRLAGAGQVEMHRLNKQVDDILDGVKTKDSNTCLKKEEWVKEAMLYCPEDFS